jgi:hypothetical protein
MRKGPRTSQRYQGSEDLGLRHHVFFETLAKRTPAGRLHSEQQYASTALVVCVLSRTQVHPPVQGFDAVRSALSSGGTRKIPEALLTVPATSSLAATWGLTRPAPAPAVEISGTVLRWPFELPDLSGLLARRWRSALSTLLFWPVVGCAILLETPF